MFRKTRRRTTARGRSKRPSHLPSAADEPDARHAFVYEMIHFRQLDQDAMLWDAPTLSFTAQAFLLTIALGPDSSSFARLTSSGLAVVVSILAMQLMAKHRFLAEMDRTRLHQLESEMGIDHISTFGWAWDPSERSRYVLASPQRTVFRAWSSYRVWQGGIAVFGLTALAVFVLVLVRPSIIAG